MKSSPAFSAMLRLSLAALALVSCGGGGGGSNGSNSSPAGSTDSEAAAKERTINVAKTLVTEFSKLGTISGAAFSAQSSQSGFNLQNLSDSSFGQCPTVTLDSSDSSFSYTLDFNSGCSSALLPFDVSGTIEGAISFSASHLEVSSQFSDFTAGGTSVDGSLTSDFEFSFQSSAADFSSHVQISHLTLRTPDLSLAVDGGIDDNLSLNASQNGAGIALHVPQGSLSVTLNDRQVYLAQVDNLIIDSSAGLLPSSGRIHVREEFIDPPREATIEFNSHTPSTGECVITYSSGGNTETFTYDLTP